MKSLVASMALLPRAFMAAILRSLLRGKSLLALAFTFWTSPTTSISPPSSSSSERPPAAAERTLDDFLREAQDLIMGPYATPDRLLALSEGLEAQFRRALAESDVSMLPSHTYRVPSGDEKGTFLAIDVGGTTLRIAVVELRGGGESEVVRCNVVKADDGVKALVGVAFFEWMADQIVETVSAGGGDSASGPLPIALTWSFPLQQTSAKDALIVDMGKGFRAAESLPTRDLATLLQSACAARALPVTLQAILNDSTACLLSRAYSVSSTRLALILGTGCNMAAFLPVSSVSRTKYGGSVTEREGGHVVVNTELSMHGGDGVLPLTRWDEELKRGHERPWFQPLEHLVSGMYLGECCRIALVEAVRTAGVFGGVVPEGLARPYSLHTETLAMVESDPSPTFDTALPAFAALHPSSPPPTPADMLALKTLATLTARRSSAIIATCVFTLWRLRTALSLEHAEVLLPIIPTSNNTTPPSDSSSSSSTERDHGQQQQQQRMEAVRREAEREARETSIAFNGAVIESYPGYRAMCQAYLDELVGEGSKVALVAARDSSLLGAAVASACELRAC